MFPTRFAYYCFLATLCSATFLTTGSVSATAQINHVDLFKNKGFQQAGNGNNVLLEDYFSAFRIFSNNSGDFTTGTVESTSIVSPISLTPFDDTTLSAVQSFATQEEMDAAIPFGTYEYTADGGTQGTHTATLNYNLDLYPGEIPYLTGNDYSALQNVAVNAPITLHFNFFASDPSASDQFRFFTIYDRTQNQFVYDAGFLPNTTDSITIAANTLTAGDAYTYEIINSNRVFDTSGTGADFVPQTGFDVRTSGNFTASPVPEMGVFFQLSGLGLGAGVFLRRKQTR